MDEAIKAQLADIDATIAMLNAERQQLQQKANKLDLQKWFEQGNKTLQIKFNDGCFRGQYFSGKEANLLQRANDILLLLSAAPGVVDASTTNATYGMYIGENCGVQRLASTRTTSAQRLRRLSKRTPQFDTLENLLQAIECIGEDWILWALHVTSFDFAYPEPNIAWIWVDQFTKQRKAQRGPWSDKGM